MKKLTVGMAVFDDFHGAYFTIQSIRLHHPEVLDRLEFLIVDNNPFSSHGRATKEFVDKWGKEKIKYHPYELKQSTSIRNEVFSAANTEYVMCLDCHVLIEPGGLKALLDFYDENPETEDLIQGPLIWDCFSKKSTHFRDEWGAGMWGKWDYDEQEKLGEPFDIPMQGLGLFSCRKAAWQKFSNNFRGFGGEEGYIHQKFRNAGHRCLCLPQLGWVHRFLRPDGAKYRLNFEDRIYNYIAGFVEVGIDIAQIKRHFVEDKKVIREDRFEEIKLEALKDLGYLPGDERLGMAKTQRLNEPVVVPLLGDESMPPIEREPIPTPKKKEDKSKVPTPSPWKKSIALPDLTSELSKEKPNLMVYGVGHSGTTILTRMLIKLGWDGLDADKGYAESLSARGANIARLKTGNKEPLDLKRWEQLLDPNKPWVVKDPRFVITLPDWIRFFTESKTRIDPPKLIWIYRDIDYVARCYAARGYKDAKGRAIMYNKRLSQLYKSAERGYDAWPFGKVQITFEALFDAFSIFDPVKAMRRQDEG